MFEKYIKWKYGKLTKELKPPLGYSSHRPAKLHVKLRYLLVYYPMWVVDCWFYSRSELKKGVHDSFRVDK